MRFIIIAVISVKYGHNLSIPGQSHFESLKNCCNFCICIDLTRFVLYE